MLRERPVAFEYVTELATGETSKVQLAKTPRGEFIAVKRLLSSLARDDDALNMFLDEVQITSQVNDPHVVKVYGWGKDAGGPYIAMELVPGVSLARLTKSVVDTREMFPDRMVAFIGAEIASGLVAAHNAKSPTGQPLGVIHRDLTPSNLLVGFAGEVKILDFGLARARERVAQTAIGTIKGVSAYSSPELMLGKEIDARADLFSLGVVMFELLTKVRPYEETIEHPRRRSANLAELLPTLDRTLATLIESLLAEAPAERLPSAREVRKQLEAWLDMRGHLATAREQLSRFVKRNALRQARWFEDALEGNVSTPATIHSRHAERRSAALTPLTSEVEAEESETHVAGGQGPLIEEISVEMEKTGDDAQRGLPVNPAATALLAQVERRRERCRALAAEAEHLSRRTGEVERLAREAMAAPPAEADAMLARGRSLVADIDARLLDMTGGRASPHRLSTGLFLWVGFGVLLAALLVAVALLRSG